MAIASARNIGLGGGLTLALGLASSAQSIQVEGAQAEGLSAIGRTGAPGICVIETGITYGEWVPGDEGYAGELHGELFDGQSTLAYRLRADMHWLALPGPGILPTQGAISGEIVSADRTEVVAYLVGDWEQTGTFGRFSAVMIDPSYPYQIPPAFIGSMEGDFTNVLESNAGSPGAQGQAGGQQLSEPSGPDDGPGNLENDLIFEGLISASGSATAAGKHKLGSYDVPLPPKQGPGNLENDLIFEGLVEASGSATPGGAHVSADQMGPALPPIGASSGAPGPEPVLSGIYYGSWTLCQS